MDVRSSSKVEWASLISLRLQFRFADLATSQSSPRLDLPLSGEYVLSSPRHWILTARSNLFVELIPMSHRVLDQMPTNKSKMRKQKQTSKELESNIALTSNYQEGFRLNFNSGSLNLNPGSHWLRHQNILVDTKPEQNIAHDFGLVNHIF